jgi:ABC-2 type transport system permease protein
MTRAIDSAAAAPAPARRWFSWGRLTQMVKKEMKQLVRDPKARPIIFVSPIVQMILLGYAATTDVKDISTMVVDHDNTAESRGLVEAFKTTDYFIITKHSEKDADVVAALAKGQVQMGLTIPPGFAADMRSGRGASVQTLFDGSDASQATVAQSYASQIAGQFGVKMVGARMQDGVELRSRAWFNPSLESKFFNVPAIMGIQILTVCLILTAMAVVREREIGTLDQLLVSPITSAEMMLGKTIPVLALGLFHLLIYTGLTVFQFGVPMRGSFVALVLASLVYILTALSLGLLISTVSKTQQEAFMLLILVLLPAVMLSGFVSPIESMPKIFQWMTVVNPIRYFLEIVRGVFLKGIGVAELWPQYLTLTAMATAIMVTATTRFRRAIA